MLILWILQILVQTFSWRDDYIYDNKGNMVSDKKKSIASIEYNYLNLPAKVTKTDGQYVKCIYNAAGGKMSQEV